MGTPRSVLTQTHNWGNRFASWCQLSLLKGEGAGVAGWVVAD